MMLLNEKADYAWPPNIIFGARAELRMRWREEMRVKRAKLLELTGEESPNWDRIRRARMAPRPARDGPPWLKMPNAYDFEDPTQYFMTDIKARHRGLLERASRQTALRSSAV